MMMIVSWLLGSWVRKCPLEQKVLHKCSLISFLVDCPAQDSFRRVVGHQMNRCTLAYKLWSYTDEKILKNGKLVHIRYSFLKQELKVRNTRGSWIQISFPKLEWNVRNSRGVDCGYDSQTGMAHWEYLRRGLDMF